MINSLLNALNYIKFFVYENEIMNVIRISQYYKLIS